MSELHMSELHSWLMTQPPGLRTYRTFQQKTIQLAHRDAQHRAFYKLLSTIVDPFIESYDEEPLPVDLAETAFSRLIAVVREAEDAIALAPERQMIALNDIAAVELV